MKDLIDLPCRNKPHEMLCARACVSMRAHAGTILANGTARWTEIQIDANANASEVSLKFMRVSD